MARPPLRQLLADESGMTLIELMIVTFILGILLSIAVPSYLGLKQRSYQSAAKSNLRATLPAIYEYGLDNSPNSRNDPDATISTSDAGYDNVDESLIKGQYDPTLDTSTFVIRGSGSSFCAYTWVNAWTASQKGPGAPIDITLNSDFDSDPTVCGAS